MINTCIISGSGGQTQHASRVCGFVKFYNHNFLKNEHKLKGKELTPLKIFTLKVDVTERQKKKKRQFMKNYVYSRGINCVKV